MSMLDLRTASFNDIVFEGRNKLYGAYVLRQLYERHLARALALAVSLTLLLVASPLVKAWFFPPMVEAAGPVVLPPPSIDVLPPPIFEKVEPAGGARPADPIVSPPAKVVPRVVPDEQVKPETKPEAPTIAPTDALPEPLTGGAVGGRGSSETGLAGPGVGPKDSGTAKTTAPPAPFLTAEVMPEFMGGQEALQRYMQQNLRYPPQALRNNIDGRVYISFTVQADGSIADVQVLKGLGFGTDEEAARVVKKMPAWKPGMQNKHSVAVRYTMPITFRYE
ncbi:energy transducer TonB [Hymenobacter norwichensis]|uniref:energy transducer TonB n=1 Tax=Hymenobacter norwichensis TaxID=223903 RepID=UPI00040D49A9|nr:energy transducer TonB [Hymenobacter norwichensis]